MLLYALASGMLGWSGIACAARASLRARNLDCKLGILARVLIIAMCMMGAICAWAVIDGVAPCIIFSLGSACMGALLVCDLREHVLPTELVALLLALAASFRLTLGGIEGMLAIGIPTAIVAASLLALNSLRARRGVPEAIGSGDARMLLPLALFSGTPGIMPGMLACALVMGVLALMQLALGRARRSSQIALAPGLATWLFVGTLVPLL